MGVIQENQTSQIEVSSPAQICAEYSDLAELVFSSNSALLIWAHTFEVFNSATSEEIREFKSPVAAICSVARSHARSHAHQP